MLNKDELKIELVVEDIKVEDEKETRGREVIAPRGVTSSGCCGHSSMEVM